MPEVELQAGRIDYEDSGGSGPAIVFVHGLMMDGSLWRHVIEDLRLDFRCIAPTLPLGGHRHPMHAEADLSMRGMVEILGEFFERLDLRDITLATNDWGGPQLLVGSAHDQRIARLALCSCEAFDNVPPSDSIDDVVGRQRLKGLARPRHNERHRPMREPARNLNFMYVIPSRKCTPEPS